MRELRRNTSKNATFFLLAHAFALFLVPLLSFAAPKDLAVDSPTPSCRSPLSDPSFSGPPSSGSGISQTSSDLDVLYGQAEYVSRPFFQFVDKIAQNTGSESIFGPLKRRERLLAKLSKTEGISAKVFDLVRAAIVCTSIDKVYTALDLLKYAFETDSNVEFVRVRDRFQNPKESGYRDLQVLVRVKYIDPAGQPQSHIAEVQVHLRALFDIKKKEADKLYRQMRELEEARQFRGRDLNETEKNQLEELKKQHRKLFDDAFQQTKSKKAG